MVVVVDDDDDDDDEEVVGRSDWGAVGRFGVIVGGGGTTAIRRSVASWRVAGVIGLAPVLDG